MMVKEYGHLLRHDPDYAKKATTVSELAVDISEVIAAENLSELKRSSHGDTVKVAFQAPCTLQHGQQLPGRVEGILDDLGYSLTTVRDAHLCCGSAGTYSILNPEIATRLKEQKLEALMQEGPEIIATANIGCLTHLQSGSSIPVAHWITLVDSDMPVD